MIRSKRSKLPFRDIAFETSALTRSRSSGWTFSR